MANVINKHYWGDNGIPMPIGHLPVPGPLKSPVNKIGYALGSAKDITGEFAGKAAVGTAKVFARAGLELTKAGVQEIGLPALRLGGEAIGLGGKALIGASGMLGKALTSAPARKFYSNVAKDLGTAAESMVTYTPSHVIHDVRKGTYTKVPGKMRFSKRGLIGIAAASLISGTIGAAQDTKAAHMGTIDSRPVTSTPDFSPRQYEKHPSRSYLDNAGATGDLVFALNALRH